MSSLLLRNLRTILTCDDGDAVLEHADLYCENGIIRGLGPDLPQTADTVIDGSHYWCYPGLINTHHHLYQVFSRNLPQVQNLELFDWLTALYEIWKGLDEQVVRLSSLTGMGELLKHGCTTCFDHHYVFPAGCGDLIGAQFAAAEELGMRMFASRGSMDLSRKDGGLPPDSVVQTVDAIMKDSARVIEAYHDPSFGSMRQVALAPCSPFSVSGELLRQSAILARQYGVRLHTHLCETRDEERYTLEHYGVRPLEYMASLGWTGPDVWYAHGIHFNDEELRELALDNMDGARGRLMDLLCNYQAIRKCCLMVVFDAYRVAGHATEVSEYHNIQVVYTKEAETADQYIEKFAHENARRFDVSVATSDGVEQVIILGQGCRLISARELKEELDRVNGMLREEYLEQPGLKRNRLYDILPEEVIRQMKEAAAEDKQD